MSREKNLKGFKGRYENDVLKPNNHVHCVQCDDAENISTNSVGTPRIQGGHKTDSTPEDRSHGNKENEMDDRRVLLAITVEIEDGCVEHIEMKEGDSAEAVAVKFCRDHSLPDQFVAPLTEHIVSNIISISKEDKDIVFCSKNECASYEEDWPRKEGCHTAPEGHDSEYKNRPAKPHGGRYRPMDQPVTASQKVQKHRCNCPGSPKKARQKSEPQKKLSDRLTAPTITSLAKTCGPEKEKPKNSGTRPISERAKAVYMRLYAEFIRQKQKLQEDKKRSLEVYQEKLERDKMVISKKSWRIMRMRGRAAKQYRNYGELLYIEGLTKRENQLKLIAQKQKDDEAKELDGLTLKPEISKRAKNIRRENGKIWSRLLHQDKPRQDLLQELRNEIWEAKLMECTFKPQINHRDGDEDYMDGSCDRFQQLFLDAESRRRRQAEYMQWYPEGVTFQPAINRRHPDGLDMDGEYQQEGCVFDRLLQYASKLTEKKQMQERLGHRPIDPATGQELFKPLTGRKPQNDRNPVHLPIGEYLYKMKFAFDSKKEGLAARDNELKKEQANCHYVGPTSQKLLGRLKERGLKNIFDCLDEDKDGSVVLATSNLELLSKDVVETILQVMKMETTANNKPLNCEKFVELMLAAEKSSHRAQPLHLVLKHRNHADDSTFTYKFEMDQLSRNLASRRRRFSSSRQWYKIICADREKRQERVEELRKKRQNQEMAECTFRPELITRSGRKVIGVQGGQGVRKGIGEGLCDSISSIVEKVQQEVHGFYFQDDRGPEWLGLSASRSAKGVSRPPSRHAVRVDDNPAEVGPMGLLESLKLMVTESREHPAAGACSADKLAAQRNNGTGLRPLSAIDDLPGADGPSQGLYFGIMGA